jgi:hypothetical protein
VTGGTDSTEATFPVAGGPDLTYNGGYDDAFVARVAPSGASLSYAGYIGGSGYDYGCDVAVGDTGDAYVTGDTNSAETTFPVAGGPGGGPDLTYNGGVDAFVARVASGGASLAYAGYIGGSGNDQGRGIAVGGLGAPYVTGWTTSDESSFPVVGGPDLTFNGNVDAFVVRMLASGAPYYAGYIGGWDNDYGYGIAVDSPGVAYVVGATNSAETTFPVAVGPDLTYGGGAFDGFIAKVAEVPETSIVINVPAKVPAGSRAKITGSLLCKDSACQNAQQVTLMKGSATAGTATTSANGAYKFALKITKKTTVQVIYAGTPTCAPSASLRKTIKVS